MDLEKLFYPRSIAFVGASPGGGSSGGKLPYYQLIKAKGYQGTMYPVNPNYQKIDGEKVFPSLEDLPEPVDLAIITVPARFAMETLRSAVRNGTKFVHFFTSGFSEVGNVELENEVKELAKKNGIRLVGPNCMGILCTESKVTFDFVDNQVERGNTAFLGQSGGYSVSFVTMAKSRKIGINKVVSMGNQIDLGTSEYIEYFAQEKDIKAIGAYLEDIKNGSEFIEILRKTNRKKPVVIFKGGSTTQGAKAAVSHTGALSGSQKIFSSVMRQTGCIETDTFEQLMDVMMLATAEKQPQGPKIGYLGGGGGFSVVATDVAVKQGLSLPTLRDSIQAKILEKIVDVNTSTINPVDLGVFGFDFNIIADIMRIMDGDNELDIIIPSLSVGMIPLKSEHDVSVLIEAIKEMEKPVFPILLKTAENDIESEKDRILLYTTFRNAGLPVFNSMQDAAYAIRKCLDWQSRLTAAV